MPSPRSLTASLAVALLTALSTSCAYDGIERLDEQVRASRSELRIELQRYADLLPTLMDVLRRNRALESETVEVVEAARADLLDALRSADFQEMQAALVRLSAALDPGLAAPNARFWGEGDLSYRILRGQLRETRQAIREAQRDYNQAVQDYNSYIREFPQLLTARLLKAEPHPYFQRIEAASDTGILAE